ASAGFFAGQSPVRMTTKLRRHIADGLKPGQNDKRDERRDRSQRRDDCSAGISCNVDFFDYHFSTNAGRERPISSPQGGAMGEPVYISKSRIERRKGPIRYAYIAGEPQPVIF